MIPRSGSDSDRGQLAECLAFISDMALTGDADATTGQYRVDQRDSFAVAPTGTCHQQPLDAQEDDQPEKNTAAGEQEDEETPEPVHQRGSGATAGGRSSRWLRHRLAQLRLQRQRSAPVAPPAVSSSVDDSVSSHIQMLNSLDSQVMMHYTDHRLIVYMHANCRRIIVIIIIIISVYIWSWMSNAAIRL